MLTFVIGVLVGSVLAFVVFGGMLLGLERLLDLVNIGRGSKYLLLMLRSVRRNPLRTALTYLAVFVLVFVITIVWSILDFLDRALAEQSKDLKVIITEKWQLPSQMPFSYAEQLSREADALPEGMRPAEGDVMTWQFYGGWTDPEHRTRENLVFFFAMDPGILRTMMDDLENLDPELVEKMKAKRENILIGRERLKAMNKEVGERILVTGLNYQGIDLEFEIVGVFPDGRYNQTAVMHRDYLNAKLDEYKYKNFGIPHALAEKNLNLVWIRLPTSAAFEELAERVGAPGRFASPAVKCETAASGIATWLDAYRDLIWGMRWLLVPALLATMTLIIATAISISVRERRSEMAVLKVLGFRPWQILTLVLGEAMLVGGSSGLLSAGVTYVVTNQVMGGFKFPIAFFPSFVISDYALWRGPIQGVATALVGSLVPALMACRVKVSQVFARVA